MISVAGGELQEELVQQRLVPVDTCSVVRLVALGREQQVAADTAIASELLCAVVC